MTNDRAAYSWSSYRWHVGVGNEFGWLDIDPCFKGLGNSADERAMRLKQLAQSAIPTVEWELIREALQRGQLTRTKQIPDEIEAITNILEELARDDEIPADRVAGLLSGLPEKPEALDHRGEEGLAAHGSQLLEVPELAFTNNKQDPSSAETL